MSDENRYKEVQADLWDTMTLTELYEQLSILQSRAITASDMNNYPMLKQIQKGIASCEGIISSRSDNDESVTIS